MLGCVMPSSASGDRIRIQPDMTGDGKQIRPVRRKRRKPLLPQMPAPPLPEIDHPGIPPVRLGKRRAKAVPAPRTKEQMHMVRHQAIRPYLRPDLRASLHKKRQIGRIVAFREKDGLPAVTALGNVVRDAGNDDTGYSRHASIIHAKGQDVN